VQCILQGLTSVLLCAPFIFVDSKKCFACDGFLCITEVNEFAYVITAHQLCSVLCIGSRVRQSGLPSLHRYHVTLIPGHVTAISLIPGSHELVSAHMSSPVLRPSGKNLPTLPDSGHKNQSII